MVGITGIGRSIGRRFTRHRQWQLQSFRCLILDSVPDSVKLRRLSDSDSEFSVTYVGQHLRGREAINDPTIEEYAVPFSCLDPESQDVLMNINHTVSMNLFYFEDVRTRNLLHIAIYNIRGIVELNLNRPESKNAIGRDMLKGLQHSLEILNEDRSAKVMMIYSSVPKVFCAGADLKERRQMSPTEVQSFVNNLRSTFSLLEAIHIPTIVVIEGAALGGGLLLYMRKDSSVFEVLQHLPAIHIPTIAVIEGAALGGGLEMALSCDLRICGENAVLGLPETGLAIIPGAGGTQRLTRLVGKSIAKELIFTGRKVSGTEAYSLGLINYCMPPAFAYSKALELAREINQKGPVALKMAKRAINEGFDMDMASALKLEEECYEHVLHTKDRLEGLAAFAEKRKPRYSGE